MKILSILLILAIILNSCSNDYSEIDSHYETINLNEAIEEAQGKTVFSIDDLIDTVKIIKLQTNDRSIMGNVMKLIVTDKHIYILPFTFRDVFIFNINGDFVKKITRGQGPGDLISVSDISYDYISDNLLVFQGKKVNKYSPEGEIVDCIHTKVTYIEVSELPKPMLCMGNLPYFEKEVICELDSAYEPIDFFEFDTQIPTIPTWHILTKSPEGGINIARLFDNTIYYYNDNTIKAKYYLDYSKYGFEESVYNGDFDPKNLELDDSKFYFGGSYLEVQDFQRFLLTTGLNNTYFCFRNRKTQKTRLCDPNKYEGSQNNLGLLTLAGYSFNYKDYFLSYICFDGIDDKVKEKVLKIQSCNQISQEDVDKIKGLTENDNPLIVLYKLKGLE